MDERDDCMLTVLEWSKITGLSTGTIKTHLGDKYKSAGKGQRNNSFPAKVLREATQDFLALPLADENNVLVIDGVEYRTKEVWKKKFGIGSAQFSKIDQSKFSHVRGRTRLGRIRDYYSIADSSLLVDGKIRQSEIQPGDFDEHGLRTEDGVRYGTMTAWCSALGIGIEFMRNHVQSLTPRKMKNMKGRVLEMYAESDIFKDLPEIVPESGFVEVDGVQMGTIRGWCRELGYEYSASTRSFARTSAAKERRIEGYDTTTGSRVSLFPRTVIEPFLSKQQFPKANEDNCILQNGRQYKTAYKLATELSTAESTIREICEGNTIQGMTRNGHIVEFYPMDVAVTNMDREAVLADEEFKMLDELKIEDAIAFLEKDPLKLKYYLLIAHPELTESDVDRLVRRSFKGFYSRSSETKEAEYLEYENELPRVNFSESPATETDDEVVTIAGKCKGSDAIYISGDWNRRVRVENDGSFSVNVPLRVGQTNELRVMGINRAQELRSPQRRFVIYQEGEPDDIEALIEMLSHLRQEVTDQIRKDPGRFEFFVQCTEQVIIKRFVTSFEEGEEYTTELIEACESSLVRRVLRRVLKNFRAINNNKCKHFRDDAPLYFFQKYCRERMLSKIEDGEPGMILANDPGLGKTRNVLSVIEEHPAVVITPNSVCSTWGEEAALSLRRPDLLTLNNMPHKQRKQLLAQNRRRHIVTNQEFLRSPDDTERFELLSRGNPIIVHDEAHSRANLSSQQSRGAQMLEGSFLLMMTATFARNPEQFCRMMHNIDPSDPRFQSFKAFRRAFPPDDPDAMRALSILKQQFVVRFRKQDVMEEFDPEIPLRRQHDRLPRKQYVPTGKYGRFTIGEEQAQAIYEMFLHWGKWTTKYDKYVPNDEVAHMDHLRQGNSMTKLHALRQTVNNPEYVNASDENAKLLEMKRIVRKCKREGRKVLIFCRYNAQAQRYAEQFANMNPALYTGITSEQGVKRDEKNKPMLFRQNPGGDWEIGSDGLPVEDSEGVPMLALDYERLRFKNSEDCGLVIATYSAGAVGVTFTAAKAVIEDDAPADYIERYQAEDRAHRIDNRFKTHYDVKYFRMQSQYPDDFLERMKTVWVHKQEDGSYKEVKSAAKAKQLDLPTSYEEFFEQGTYDEVHGENLEVQRRMFHLINDGIADESILDEDQIGFKGL